MSRRYITTAIPYVKSKPHLGFAMELVQTDVMARHWRHSGHEVRFLSGTDDNSLKNAIVAEAEGVPTSELVGGRCPEHQTAPQLVSEENWFFKLSRYEDQLRELIESAALRIEPDSRRNEVLGFIKTGLQDFSISRSTERARGWGIAVPGDILLGQSRVGWAAW